MRLRVCKSREELIALLRERRDELDISHVTIDAIAGISEGYTSKVLSLTPIKQLGPMSLGAILGALGLKICTITIGEDPQAKAEVAGRWQRRRRKPNPRKVASAPADWCVVSERQTSFSFEDTGEADMAKTISVRVDAELDERLNALAAKERRKVSQFVRNVLTDAVKPQPGEGDANAKPEVAA